MQNYTRNFNSIALTQNSSFLKAVTQYPHIKLQIMCQKSRVTTKSLEAVTQYQEISN